MLNKEPTHRVVFTAESYKDEPDVQLTVSYTPLVEEDSEDEYLPASYHFIGMVLNLAASIATGGLDLEEDDLGPERSIN